MKKLLLIFIILSSSIAMAGIIEYSSLISAPEVLSNDRFSAPSNYLTHQPGEPEIPFECYRIILPHGAKIDDVIVRLDDYHQFSGQYDIPHAQMPSVIGQPVNVTPEDEKIYNSNHLYPYKDYELAGVGRLAGIDFAVINVFPYKYNPVAKELGYYEQVNIEIETSQDAETKTQQEKMISKNNDILARLNKLTVNPSMLDSYPDRNVCSHSKDLVDPNDPHNFLIITSEEFLDIFNDYADWKEEHGISAVVYTVEDIFDEYFSEADNAANLRSFIIDAYEAWAGSSDPLMYVLLGGDDEIIPVRGCWGYNDYSGEDLHIPCDFYYGALDGDWNANGNEYYGEVDDDPDLYAEVHIGRFPGDIAQDFENMIYKITQYVEHPNPSLYNALMVGELLATNPVYWGGDFCDLICDNPQYLPSYYNVTKLYDRDGTFSTAAVTNMINRNQTSLVFHVAHTHYYYLWGWSQLDIHNLTNTEYPLVATGGCYTLAFEQATSGYAEAIGEHALFAEPGMMMFIGHSRIGFTTWIDFMQLMLVSIFHEEDGAVGAGLTYCRDNLAHMIGNCYYRWEFYEIILAGDPQVNLINEAIGITDNSSSLPERLSLSQNYPNPFNAATAIRYQLPAKSDVSIEIFDILGRKVTALVDKEQPAGEYRVIWNAEDIPSGVYFYRIKADDYSVVKRMALLK